MNPTAKKLRAIAEAKQSNLCFNPDVTSSAELLHYADLIGPSICLLKTHIDILRDFSIETTHKLRELADRHNFLIFEDRKLGDIGTIAKEQYAGGIYQIAEWADIINAHSVSGPGIVEALREVGLPKGRALLLLAQMSSKGSLACGDYTKQTVSMANAYPDFVIGYICQEKVDPNPDMLHLTPGVNLAVSGDPLGQQYRTPQIALGEQGCDIIIVGRGILQAEDPVATAEEYRKASWTTLVTI